MCPYLNRIGPKPITMEGDLGTYAPFSLAKWSRSSMVTLGSET